jgi:hypothetical protein
MKDVSDPDAYNKIRQEATGARDGKSKVFN